MNIRNSKGRLIIKFVFIFVIFLIMHIMIFGLIEKNIINREMKYYNKYEKDIAFTQKVIIESKIENVLLEIRYLLDESSNHAILLDGVFCEECNENLIDYAHSDNVDKKIYVYNRYGEMILYVESENGEVAIEDSPEREAWSGIGFKSGDKQGEGLEVYIEADTEKQIIRVIAPVVKYDSYDGVIVTEYSFKELAEKLKLFVEDYNAYTYIYNGEGEMIFRSKEDQNEVDLINWRLIKEQWDKIKTTDEGQIETEDGFFTFESIEIAEKYNENKVDVSVEKGEWKIVILNRNLRYRVNRLGHGGFEYLIVEYIHSQKLAMILIFILAILTQAYFLLRKNNKKKIEVMASRDIMTGVYNRARGMEKIHEQLKKCVQKKEALTVVFIDINGLKLVNDNLGHAAGDELIVGMVNIIKQFLRENDFLVRLGGDEFLMILPEKLEDEAQNIFQRINEKIHEHNESDSKLYNMSFSHGISSFEVGKEVNAFNLINEADKKMYERKREMKKNLKILK